MEINFLTVVILSTIVTVCVRTLPIILLSEVRLPGFIYNWLGFIPASIMAAIIVAELMASPAYTTRGWSISALAATAALAAGVVSRSLLWTVLVGIVTFTGLQAILG